MIRLNEIAHNKILWSSLNWGLGHVYRSVPLIQRLQEYNNIFHIACDAKQQAIFERYLENITYHSLKGYDFKFANGKSILATNFFQLPKLFRQLGQDFQTCEKIVTAHDIDIVISDHRYGFCSKKKPSIFLTHQCQLPTKSKLIQKQHHRFIHQNFQTVWVLDNEHHQFAGKLSQSDKFQIPVEYIGITSRFERMALPEERNLSVAIISGPEPFNQELLEEIQLQAEQQQEKIHIITALDFNSDWLIPVHPENQDETILRAKKIISYCGYTTLMDLEFLQPVEMDLKATPKQGEQEYLARLRNIK